MEYAVKLPHAPADLAFPQRLEERVRYDASRGELIYRGFMTKCTYDELSALSDDADYHRALERLFVLTSSDVAPSTKRRFPTAAIAATIAAIAIAAGAFWFGTWNDSSGAPPPSDAPVTVATVAQ